MIYFLSPADEIFAKFAKSKGGPTDSLDSSRRGSFVGNGNKNPSIVLDGEEPSGKRFLED